MKVNGHGGKFMVKLGESERSEATEVDALGPKRHKVDGLRKCTVQKTKLGGPQEGGQKG